MKNQVDIPSFFFGDLCKENLLFFIFPYICIHDFNDD